MMDGIDVLVIGTDPPCPRCDLLTLRVHEAAEALERPIAIRHCFFYSDEAAALGQAANRRVGTPKHVSAEADITVDWDHVDELIGERRRVVGAEARAAQTWTPAVDALLDPCREAAEALGFFMTPILVVNGAVKHHGSVSTVEQIREWLVSA
jgi:Thioredoxin domain